MKPFQLTLVINEIIFCSLLNSQAVAVFCSTYLFRMCRLIGTFIQRFVYANSRTSRDVALISVTFLVRSSLKLLAIDELQLLCKEPSNALENVLIFHVRVGK